MTRGRGAGARRRRRGVGPGAGALAEGRKAGPGPVERSERPDKRRTRGPHGRLSATRPASTLLRERRKVPMRTGTMGAGGPWAEVNGVDRAGP